ncbi:cardiolipin synthase B, partial [Mesorhizobium sp. M7A.T.Ca.TU.009.01.3.1]
MKSPRRSKSIAIASSGAIDVQPFGSVASGARKKTSGIELWRKVLVYLAIATMASLLTVLIITLTPEPRVLRSIVPHRFDATDPQFSETMSSYSQGQMFDSNAVQTLINGDEIFPSMLQAIGAARSSVDMETYIYWSGAIGYEFAIALAAKASEGVEVRVNVDWVGSLPFDEDLIHI